MGVLELLIIAVLVGIGASYATKVLILEEKDSHEGPFIVKNVQVYFPEISHLQRASIFDRVRRLFGAYSISKPDGDGFQLWTVTEKSEVWTCPFCLSFWVCAPFTIFLTAVTGMWLWIIIIHLIIVATSSFINYRLFS